MPSVSSRRVVAAVAVLALVVASVLLLTEQTPPQGRTLQSFFEDDQLLVDQPDSPAGNATVSATLATLKSLGVDRIRVLVVWRQIAPGDDDPQPPAGFRAAEAGDYGGGWFDYDRVDRAAAAAGIRVYFDLTDPAPEWALTRQPAGTAGPARADADVYGPSAIDFEQFVEAAGRRYSGHYVPPGAGGRALPRVSFWSVWNEPNQPGWLSPQASPATGRPLAPALYRALADAFWDGLVESGHTTATDTILLGELAPNGCVSGGSCGAFAPLGHDYLPIPPLNFLDELYCVGTGGADDAVGTSGSADLRQVSGAAATAIGCPAHADAGRFVADNPILFQASGVAEHPYSFFQAPNESDAAASERGFVTLAELSRLEATIDSLFTAYGQGRRLPVYLTEYGYVTDPPNPDYPVTPAEQALYLDEATYLAAQDPRVRALSQFELQDSNPALDCAAATGHPCTPRTKGYWDNFEEGLEFLGGAPKPAFAAYRLPIFLPQLEGPTRDATRGEAVQVWGMLRPAPNDTTQTAEIQWRGTGGASFRTIATTTTRDPSGIISESVALPGSGSVRLAWTPPHGATIYSRTVAVTVTVSASAR